MHTISVSYDGTSWRVDCSCGWCVSGLRYAQTARDLGNGHKDAEVGNPNNADNYRDDPRIGY